jgi:Putative DNA-binding domain
MKKRQTPIPNQRARVRASVVSALQRQEVRLSFVKKETWTEEDVASLPSGEHDYFERKSGRLFDDPSDRNALYETLAKQGSAFANSGGGHLVLGVNDDGGFDGVPSIVSGKTATRDWLEQKIPELLDYPLRDFRVHTVPRTERSTLPPGRELIVIDFGDSALAPHQSRKHTGYFYRSAGRSIPAPHFYLELLRQRLTNAALEFDVENAQIDKGWEHQGALYLRIEVQLLIQNVGRVAGYKWSLVPRAIDGFPEGRSEDYLFGAIPGASGRNTSVRIDDTILPGCACRDEHVFGVLLRPSSRTEDAVKSEVAAMLSKLKITYQLATETSPGEKKEVSVGERIQLNSAIQFLQDWILLP